MGKNIQCHLAHALHQRTPGKQEFILLHTQIICIWWLFHHYLKPSLLNLLHLEIPVLGAARVVGSEDPGMQEWKNSGIQEWKKEVFRGGNLQHIFSRAMQPLSSPSSALHRQPCFWRDEFHTHTRGQLAGREKLSHSHLIFPVLLIKRAAGADS